LSVVIIPKDDKGLNLDKSLVIEATISETHSLNYQITDKPRENDTSASDNIIRNPRVLNLDCLISDDSNLVLKNILVKNQLRDYRSAGHRFLTEPSDTLAELEKPYSFDVWEYLKKIADKKYPLLVDTSLELYYPMYIESISDVIRNKKYTKALRFKMQLREIIQVASKKYTKKTEPVNTDKAASKKDQGTKKPELSNPSETFKYKTSVAFHFGDWTGARAQ